jgi:two-component system sensor histidine kinase SenX3
VGVAVALALTALVGVAVGIVVARWSARRKPVPPLPSGHGDEPRAGADIEVLTSLRAAVEQLEIGVLVADDSGEVHYRNAAATAFRGTHIGLLVDDHVGRALAGAIGGASNVRTVELQGPPKRWLEISASAVPAGGAVVTIRDVGERVRTDAMRTDFVTNISHELKTPVGAVAVLAEALIDETDPVIVQRLSDHLVDEAHRAVRTIDDLLKLSEIESTKPGDEVVDLASVVQSAVARGRIVDGGRGVEITSLDVPDGLRLRGDERQLQSAVGNLVENAVKYSHGGGAVQVRVRVDDAAVEVMVADQGIGIPRRDLDRVFERFYRVDRARSRDTGGTGLGLAIVRHVANNHGGDVLVSSQEGEGSTFVLRLPASLVVDPGERSTVGREQEHHE